MSDQRIELPGGITGDIAEGERGDGKVELDIKFHLGTKSVGSSRMRMLAHIWDTQRAQALAIITSMVAESRRQFEGMRDGPN